MILRSTEQWDWKKKENVREREIEEIAYLLNNLMGDRRGVNRL